MQLRKEKKATFEDDIPSMKTEMNHNLLTQKIENIKHMEYSEKTVKLIARVIEDFRNNTMEKGAIFSQRYFLHKGFKKMYKKGMVR